MNIGFDFNSIETFGCVVIIDDFPHLFILDDGDLLDGIPLFDDNELFLRLEDNELIIVGLEITDENGNLSTVQDITDDNYDELVYVVTPIKFHTLKTEGLTVEDIMDLQFFDAYIIGMVEQFQTNLKLLN